MQRSTVCCPLSLLTLFFFFPIPIQTPPSLFESSFILYTCSPAPSPTQLASVRLYLVGKRAFALLTPTPCQQCSFASQTLGQRPKVSIITFTDSSHLQYHLAPDLPVVQIPLVPRHETSCARCVPGSPKYSQNARPILHDWPMERH